MTLTLRVFLPEGGKAKRFNKVDIFKLIACNSKLFTHIYPLLCKKIALDYVLDGSGEELYWMKFMTQIVSFNSVVTLLGDKNVSAEVLAQDPALKEHVDRFFTSMQANCEAISFDKLM